MRKCYWLAFFFLLVGGVDLLFFFHARQGRLEEKINADRTKMIVAELGLSDLVLSTEARYTRHPAVSDNVVPQMDYPGNLEHFPSGSFFQPPDNK